MNASKIEIGTRVEVNGRGQGDVDCENADGTWSVTFDDGSEEDIHPDVLQVIGSMKDTLQPVRKPALDLASGARIVDNPDADPKPDGWTRFVCFSDTHGLHDSIPKGNCPSADVLLHAGDFTNIGEVSQVESFNKWLKAYPAKVKVVIAGNHDITFHEEHYGKSRFYVRMRNEDGTVDTTDCQKVRKLLKDCIYLEDSSAEVCGYMVYGSPWQPEFCEWAFNLPQGQALREKWMQIPESVDILLTHGPPKDINDSNTSGMRCGCQELRAAIKQRPVSVNVSGHIHEGYGYSADDATLYVNASTCTHGYRPTNPPIVFDLPPPAELRAATQRAAARRREETL
mmetsp:Transcript_102390/g.177668  ORF Transcript_102390/g.177668 Transcript_102390/m.177668 type:complete len:341 (+) Transcript_102390:59-1081(+)